MIKYTCKLKLHDIESLEVKEYRIVRESKYPIPYPTLRKQFITAIPDEIEECSEFGWEIINIEEEMI